MRLLLDTHILVWLQKDAALLRPGEREMVATASLVAASVVSLWELRLKLDRRFASGRRKGPVDPAIVLDWIQGLGLRLLDLTAPVAIAALDPPLAYGDPFDELLLVQAQQGGYRLLTRDAKLAGHPLALVPA